MYEDIAGYLDNQERGLRDRFVRDMGDLGAARTVLRTLPEGLPLVQVLGTADRFSLGAVHLGIPRREGVEGCRELLPTFGMSLYSDRDGVYFGPAGCVRNGGTEQRVEAPVWYRDAYSGECSYRWYTWLRGAGGGFLVRVRALIKADPSRVDSSYPNGAPLNWTHTPADFPEGELQAWASSGVSYPPHYAVYRYAGLQPPSDAG
jgi:hypothetical protein